MTLSRVVGLLILLFITGCVEEVVYTPALSTPTADLGMPDADQGRPPADLGPASGD